MFSGSITALVTPFVGDSIDERQYRALVDWQVQEGTAALVPCGTTGESSTMTMQEHDRVVALCVEAAASRIPVIAGCGSNDTRVSAEHMRRAREVGASAALVVLPYYNRPQTAGVIEHFTRLADGCDLPIIVYNVPPRTGIDLDLDTLSALASIPSVVGIKDASSDVVRVSATRQRLGEDFLQLSGCDDSALAFMAMGGQGCNVAPRLCAEFQAACRSSDWNQALILHDRLFPLHQALFSDASPGPTKYAMSRVLGDFPVEVRAPIVPPSTRSREIIDQALMHAGLLATSG
jgi:4-hydroxy-tetrahydrodipicolinate synthase